ncbi:MAG: hypothetical protein AAF546_13110 [Verrucomicrobiota bacterium]
MDSEDDSRLILSKWPFYLGDALLVSSALAIAILGDWQLSDWQVAACVTAVALGAAILILPFVVEFYLRAQEVADDRSFEIRRLSKWVETIEDQLKDVFEQVDELARRGSEESPGQKALVEAVDRKLKNFDEFVADLAKVKRECKSEIDAIKKSLSELNNSAEITALSSKLESFEDKLKETVNRKTDYIAPRRMSRKKRKPDAPLINRAIKAERGQRAAVVERLIERQSKPEDSVSKQKAPKVTKPTRLRKDIQEPSTKSSSKMKRSKETDESESSSVPGFAPARKDSENPSIDLDAEVPLIDSSDMLFDDVPIKPRARKSRAKRADTVVTVNALIGIGNKPFIRGSGGGLNWEKGIPMEFQEIGKWRWLAPVELDQAIEIEIYRNDEELDQSGRHRINSGQKFEITPVFL